MKNFLRKWRKSIILAVVMMYFGFLLGKLIEFQATEVKVVEVPAAPTPLIKVDTLNPAILKQFVQIENPKIYSRLADEIVSASINYATKYQLSPILILSVMLAESDFNINAVSKTGARGLMQIQPDIWLDTLATHGMVVSITELHDPEKNIEAGTFVLRTYLDETGDFEAALNKYLGTDCVSYRKTIENAVGSILMLGIQREINAPYKRKMLEEKIKSEEES